MTYGTDKSVPYNAVFGADQTGTCGTGKPVPYEVRRKIRHHTTGLRTPQLFIIHY